MLRATPCSLHTFDHTFDGASVHAGRHFYHKRCIGGSGAAAAQLNGRSTWTSGSTACPEGSNATSWQGIVQELGLQSIELAKVDIEGAEYGLLASWAAPRGDDAALALPEQLAIELHRTSPNAEGALHLHAVFAHLASLGYAPVSLEHNSAGGGCCAELTFLRL